MADGPNRQRQSIRGVRSFRDRQNGSSSHQSGTLTSCAAASCMHVTHACASLTAKRLPASNQIEAINFVHGDADGRQIESSRK
jgi:hypothetical protein